MSDDRYELCDVCLAVETDGFWPADIRGETHCRVCHRTWGGVAECHCGQCHEHFSSVSSFARHFASGGRCMTREEMASAVGSESHNPLFAVSSRKRGEVWLSWRPGTADWGVWGDAGDDEED